MAVSPFVYVSVNIWRTIHPLNTVVPSLRPGMRGAVLVLRRRVSAPVRAAAQPARLPREGAGDARRLYLAEDDGAV